MANENPADLGGRRHEAEHETQIAATYNQHLDSLEECLLQAMRDMYGYTGPTNISGAPIMLIHMIVRTVRQKLIFKMGRQDIDPRLQLMYALITVALGCVSCSLLMYMLLGDMPWLIIVPCILMWIISSNPRIN